MSDDLRDLIDQLDALVANARPLRFARDWVSLERDPVYELLDRMRTLAPPELQPAIDDIDGFVVGARQIPLKDAARVKRQEIAALVDRLRAVNSGY